MDADDRLPAPLAKVYQNGPLEIDLERSRVRVEQAALDVSGLRMLLLLQLARHADDVLSREELRAHLWRGHADEKRIRAVDVLVCRLRSRLGVAGGLIESVRSHGYRLRGAEPERRTASSPPDANRAVQTVIHASAEQERPGARRAHHRDLVTDVHVSPDHRPFESNGMLGAGMVPEADIDRGDRRTADVLA